MNALCDPYREHLALYAEGEIAEPALRGAIGIHLLQCPDCRDWIEGYEEFTKDIVELVSPPSDRIPGHPDTSNIPRSWCPWMPPGLRWSDRWRCLPWMTHPMAICT